MSENDLKLEESVFRFLFASPARFVGECAGDGYYLTIAFPKWRRQGNAIPFKDESRFVLSIRAEPHDKKSIKIETYEWVGEEVSALLGAFYGKLIHNLGHIQSGSIHCVPMPITLPSTDGHCMPFNSDQRKPDGLKLNLCEANRVIAKYVASQGEEALGWILRAAEFYRVALESFHSRPEVALAMFCSTLEALLPLREYTEEELCDKSLAGILKRIAEHCPNGDKIVRGLKSRLYQIKRRVVAFVDQHVPDSYFEQREATLEWAVAKDRADLISRVKSVYDLRSKVLHTGERLGLNYLAHEGYRSEIGLGTPVLGDKKLEKLLAGALTLTGIERVVATVLREVIGVWLMPGPPAQATED